MDTTRIAVSMHHRSLTFRHLTCSFSRRGVSFRPISVTTIIALASLCSCSSTRVDLVQTGKYQVELNVPEGYMASTTASEDDGSLILTGRITRIDHKHLTTRGYVEVTLIAPDGSNIEASTAEYQPWATHRTHGKSTFEVRFTPIPQSGTKLKVQHIVEKSASS